MTASWDTSPPSLQMLKGVRDIQKGGRDQVQVIVAPLRLTWRRNELSREDNKDHHRISMRLAGRGPDARTRHGERLGSLVSTTEEG